MKTSIRAVAVAVALILLPAAWSWAAEAVRVRTGRHDGYVRIVFDWPHAVGHYLERDGDAMRLAFDAALDVDLWPARRVLGPLVSRFALGPDGRSVLATLAAGVGVTSFEAGTRVVLDFAAGARDANAAETPVVAVRANEEDGRLRIVFDWPASVGYDLERDAGGLRLSFDRAARFDLAGLESGVVTLVSRVVPEADGRVRIDTVKGASAEVTTVGHRVVVDIVRGAPAAASEAPRASPAPPLPAPKPEPASVATAPSIEDPTPRDPAVASPITVVPPVLLSAVRPGRPLGVASSQLVAMRRPVPPARIDGALWPMLARVIRSSDGAVRLRFVVNRPIAMAALVRGTTFVVAFDGRFDALLSGASSGGACADLARLDASSGTVLGCTVPEGYGAEVTREGAIWEVRLASDARPPARPLMPETGEDLKVVIRVAGGGAPVTVAPTEGDSITLVPLPAPGAGVVADIATLGYRLVPTSQGIGVAGLARGVTVEVGADTVALVLEAAAGTIAADGLLDLRGAVSSPEALTEAANRLALDGDPAHRAIERLNVARALFASGFVVEAWGQIRRVSIESPQTAARPDVQALAGVILLRLGRVREAAALLDDPLLGGGWVDGWRAVLDGMRGRYAAVAANYSKMPVDWVDLPERLRTWLGLEMARGLALGGEPAVAQAVLAIAVGKKPTGQLRDRAVLVAGYIRDALHETDKAVQIWRSLATSDDRLVAAEARFAAVEALVRGNAISTPDAIEALEQLSFAWRGGDREWRRLRRLIDLYLVNQQHRDALVAMRTLITYVPEAPDTQDTARRMAQLFKDIMIGTASQFLSPLGSLAVFQEFQELTPVGAEGDALIESLAERLAEVDLVAQAGDLLEQQLAGRLSGEARARVGLRVAELRLAAGDPEAALDALAALGEEPTPAALLHRRRMAQARAFAALGRIEEARLALAGDLGIDAVWLRADMAWRDGDWAGATSHIESLLSRSSVVDGPWGDRGALALRLAVGYATAGDLAAAAATGRRFARLFEDDPRRDMFALVTAPEGPASGDWHALPAAIADISDFEAFMASFKATAAAGPAAPTDVN
ncbi:MAG: hypothetical protein WD673_09745 [Alphaproteobacteria bacterium]